MPESKALATKVPFPTVQTQTLSEHKRPFSQISTLATFFFFFFSGDSFHFNCFRVNAKTEKNICVLERSDVV